MTTTLIIAVVALLLAFVLSQGLLNFIPTPQDELLRLNTSATITSTTATNSYDMGPGFSPGGAGVPVAGVIECSAVDRADSNETYTFTLQESDDNSTFFDCSPSRQVTAVGTYSVIGYVNRRYVRINRVLAGTTPSLTSQAFVNFNIS